MRADPALGARLSPRYPFLRAEVVFAVQQEYAISACDVLARRTRLAFLSAAEARAALPIVIDLMAPLLGWGAAQRKAEVASTEAFLLGMAPLVQAPEPLAKLAVA